MVKTFGLKELILITGFAQLYIGMFAMFFVGVLLISNLIVEGKLDQYLSLPVPLAVSLLGEHFRMWGLPYFLIGAGIVIRYAIDCHYSIYSSH